MVACCTGIFSCVMIFPLFLLLFAILIHSMAAFISPGYFMTIGSSFKWDLNGSFIQSDMPCSCLDWGKIYSVMEHAFAINDLTKSKCFYSLHLLIALLILSHIVTLYKETECWENTSYSSVCVKRLPAFILYCRSDLVSVYFVCIKSWSWLFLTASFSTHVRKENKIKNRNLLKQ